MIVSLFGFLFVMWILILIGGAIVVTILGPFSIDNLSEQNWIVSSGIKAIIAIGLAIIWIYILLKVKNWIFKKQIKS